MEQKVSPWFWPDLRSFVAISMIAIFAVVVFSLLFKPMPMTDQAGTLLLTIIGMLLAKVGSIIDFFYSSTKDSKEKDETSRTQAVTIATMAAAVPVAPPAVVDVLGPPERVITPATPAAPASPAGVKVDMAKETPPKLTPVPSAPGT
jgi:hypothetical protein